MKIEIDTNKDSYDMWKKIQILVERVYCQPAERLVVKPGGKVQGTTSSRYNIL